ncbi:PREDICTED: RNA-directed DNA polymerase from mobile element jockey-like [Rhagoletis zephyria]|uniref:RNA-directed DNA polymerase from mobile element jockey-like n=1 Tax=Rhagoletis zephyria TaxID=28612 RepID=UPI0008118E6B|nr:PREDICTED: RNA-directed DNA polymerase from mobile element jockey-like [Rhagoletis zephyria]
MVTSDLADCLSWSCPSQTIAGDHFPIFMHNGNTHIEKKIIRRFKEKQANWELFRNKTDLFDNQFVQSDNVNREAALLKRIIRKSANESMPTTRCPKRKSSPVWFNAEINTLIREKRKAWKKFRENKTPTRTLNYRRLCAQVRRACKKAKQETWKCFVNSLNPTIDAKTLWGKVRKIKSNTISSFPPIFTNSTAISHPKQKANHLARVWSSLGSNDKLGRCLTQQKLEAVTLAELHLALKNAKGTSPGKDKITYAMVKNSSSVFKIRFCRLYSNILKTGIYPHDWKEAVLIPIPKLGRNQNSVEGYQPISLLPVLSKILDKIVTRRLWKACDGKILKIQHAYMPNHGVHTLCQLLETKIKKNLNRQKHCILVSEDLEKAFDRVISTVVIKELHCWGIPKILLKLALSFLSHRRISVKVDGFLSQNYKLDNGIPQGSFLSVFLFNAYTNTLSKTLKDIHGIDFVDTTS